MGTPGIINLVDYRVTKSNELVEAGYKLSLVEQRLVLAAISQIDSRKPISIQKSKGVFRISAAKYASLFNVSKSTSFESLRASADSLFEKQIVIYGKNSKIIDRFRWVSRVKYLEDMACVEVTFTEKILKHLVALENNFTSYYIENVSKLKSPYAIRLYELLMQVHNSSKEKNFRKISLEKFRERLTLVDKYPRFNNLKSRVIQPAINEINEYTDIEVKLDSITKGRKVTDLIFNFSSKPADEDTESEQDDGAVSL